MGARLRDVQNDKTIDKVEGSNSGMSMSPISRYDAMIEKHKMKRELVLLAAISLGGCLPNQAKDVVV